MSGGNTLRINDLIIPVSTAALVLIIPLFLPIKLTGSTWATLASVGAAAAFATLGYVSWTRVAPWRLVLYATLALGIASSLGLSGNTPSLEVLAAAAVVFAATAIAETKRRGLLTRRRVYGFAAIFCVTAIVLAGVSVFRGHQRRVEAAENARRWAAAITRRSQIEAQAREKCEPRALHTYVSAVYWELPPTIAVNYARSNAIDAVSRCLRHQGVNPAWYKNPYGLGQQNRDQAIAKAMVYELSYQPPMRAELLPGE